MTWTVDLPVQHRVSQNDRHHWAAAAKHKRALREVAGWRARLQRIPVQAHIVCTLHYRPAVFRIADPENLAPTLKAAIDGLRDAGVVPDDDPRYVTTRETVIEKPGKPALWLEIQTSDEEAA